MDNLCGEKWGGSVWRISVERHREAVYGGSLWRDIGRQCMDDLCLWRDIGRQCMEDLCLWRDIGRQCMNDLC
jgi:hypothetical protein